MAPTSRERCTIWSRRKRKPRTPSGPAVWSLVPNITKTTSGANRPARQWNSGSKSSVVVAGHPGVDDGVTAAAELAPHPLGEVLDVAPRPCVCVNPLGDAVAEEHPRHRRPREHLAEAVGIAAGILVSAEVHPCKLTSDGRPGLPRPTAVGRLAGRAVARRCASARSRPVRVGEVAAKGSVVAEEDGAVDANHGSERAPLRGAGSLAARRGRTAELHRPGEGRVRAVEHPGEVERGVGDAGSRPSR